MSFLKQSTQDSSQSMDTSKPGTTHFGNVFGSETRFVPAGTLVKPSFIGRMIRLLNGILILILLVPSIAFSISYFSTSTSVPREFLLWVAIALAFLNVNHVVNLGLGRSWGRRPQYLIVAIVMIAIALDLGIYQSIWAPPLGLFIYLWLLVEYIPLGIAFLLAGILATPGCEMRSYHHLVALVLGQEPTEHFCPGGIDFADHWELNLKRKKTD